MYHTIIISLPNYVSYNYMNIISMNLKGDINKSLTGHYCTVGKYVKELRNNPGQGSVVYYSKPA